MTAQEQAVWSTLSVILIALFVAVIVGSGSEPDDRDDPPSGTT